MPLSELIYDHPEGGSIHRYEIIGGKRKFTRFIGCYLASCKFHKKIEDATEYIKNLHKQQIIQNLSLKDT